MSRIILRGSTVGTCLRAITHWKFLSYPEDDPAFLKSDQFQKFLQAAKNETDISEKSSSPARSCSTSGSPSANANLEKSDENTLPVTEHDRQKSETRVPLDETIIVGWYGDQDPANPRNWPTSTKIWTHGLLYLYIFSIYMGASISTPAQPRLIGVFGISTQVSSLTLSLYVLGYGIGPLLWSPLSEIPRLGRNLPYIPTMAVFVILCIPAALSRNIAGLLVVRFLQGFFGSPVLSIAAGSFTDMMPPASLVYSLILFQATAFIGPGTGPVISAFAVAARSWRWAFWELLIISGVVFLIMLVALPETSPDAILLNRAKRLRKLTGSYRFVAQSEVATLEFRFTQKLQTSLLVPAKLTFQDPAVAYANVFVSLNYAIYYSFFEVFPLVYEGIYGFSPQITAVLFTSIAIAAILAVIGLLLYLTAFLKPRMKKSNFQPEAFLIPTLFGGSLLPVGLFLFAWTSRTSVYWLVPTIGIVIYCAGNFSVFRGVLTYVVLMYPKYAASLSAGNTFFRSVLAAAAIHFSQPLFDNLGVGRGVSVLAGLTFGFWLLAFPLWYYGAQLRARSTFSG